MLIPDYTRLNQFLINKSWKEADIETRSLMLLVTGADKRQDILLTESDIQHFPCEILESINDLWVKASHGKFGFSIVSSIYRSVDGDYSKLAELVGWKKGVNWINYDQISFSNDANIGHLPLTWVVPSTFSIYWSSRFASAGWKRLLSRIEICKINMPRIRGQ